MMEFLHAPGRIWMTDDKDHMIAEIDFPYDGDGVVNITHTFVDDSLRGQGVAGQLVQEAAEQLRREGKKARLTCSYAQVWFKRHKEYADLIVSEEK